MKRVLFLLGHLKDIDIEWMINNGSKNKLEVGDRVIQKGEKVDNLYIILSGKLAITGSIDNNTIAEIGVGEVVGEMSFLENRSPSVSVLAIEPSLVFTISKKTIEQRLQFDAQFKANFYYALALFLSNRLRTTTSQLGYGNSEEVDLIDETILDGVSQAGARFNEILHKFSEV